MKRIQLRTATLLITLFTCSSVLAQTQPYAGQHGPMGGWGWGWGGMLLGPIMMLAFLVAAAAVVALVIRWINSDRTGSSGVRTNDRSALDILKERYARGEIDTEEFESRKRVLKD